MKRNKYQRIVFQYRGNWSVHFEFDIREWTHNFTWMQLFFANEIRDEVLFYSFTAATCRLQVYLNWWRMRALSGHEISRKKKRPPQFKQQLVFSFPFKNLSGARFFFVWTRGEISKYLMLMTNFKETNIDGVYIKVYPEFFVLLMPQQLVVTSPRPQYKTKTGFPLRKCYSLQKSPQLWLV